MFKVVPEKEFVTFMIQLMNKYDNKIEDIFKECNTDICVIDYERDDENKVINITDDGALDKLNNCLHEINDVRVGVLYSKNYWNDIIKDLVNIDDINHRENESIIRNQSHVYDPNENVIENLKLYWDWLLNKRIPLVYDTIVAKMSTTQKQLYEIIIPFKDIDYKLLYNEDRKYIEVHEDYLLVTILHISKSNMKLDGIMDQYELAYSKSKHNKIMEKHMEINRDILDSYIDFTEIIATTKNVDELNKNINEYAKTRDIDIEGLFLDYDTSCTLTENIQILWMQLFKKMTKCLYKAMKEEIK